MTGLLTGVIGGATVALLIWLAKMPGEVRNHDRLIGDRDEDLATWVADEKLRLDRRLEEILKEMSSRGALYSGDRNWQRMQAKEHVLHAWRDQERQARRFRAELEAREEWVHRLWRRLWRRPLPELTTPKRAKPILDLWREGETFDDTSATPIDDPTTRTLDNALADLRDNEPA